MNKLIPIIILLFTGIGLQAQPNLDSLYALWQDNSLDDSTRVAAYRGYIWKGFLYSQPDTAFVLAEKLLKYGLERNYLKAQALGYNIQGSSWYLRGDYPKALDYYTQYLKLIEQVGDQKGIALALNNIGLVYDYQGDYPKALDYYTQSLKIQEQIRDQKGIALALNNIGVIYMNQGNYPKALDYYTKSLKIREQIDYQKGISGSFNNIGNIHGRQGEYPKALEYFTKSLKIKEQIGDQRGITLSLNNIGLIYQNQGEYPKALDNFTKSLKIQEQIGDQRGIAFSFNNIGDVYRNQDDYTKALDYYTKSLKIQEQIGDQKGATLSLINIGNIYNNLGDYSQALDNCQRGYKLAVTIGALEFQKDGCTCLYETYKAKGNGIKALEYHELLDVIEDSLHLEETTKKLQQIEFQKTMLQDSIAKVEEARLIQEAHKEEIRAEEKVRNISLGIGVLILLLAGGLYNRLRYVRKSKATLQVEKDRSENLLLNILPEEIAKELKEKGKADARDFDQVSILFSDFKGFTELSAKLSATDLVNEINYCFKGFDGIMKEYGIEKIKTIGDAYMAAGGLPVPTDNSVKKTVLAALEMQEFISKRKAEMDAVSKPAFEMRAGIHTGPVVAGIVGINKFQYDVWGDTVNTASRIESNGEVGKVNLSQATYKLLKEDPDFIFENRGKIQVKGKGNMEMYFVEKKLKKE